MKEPGLVQNYELGHISDTARAKAGPPIRRRKGGIFGKLTSLLVFTVVELLPKSLHVVEGSKFQNSGFFGDVKTLVGGTTPTSSSSLLFLVVFSRIDENRRLFFFNLVF